MHCSKRLLDRNIYGKLFWLAAIIIVDTHIIQAQTPANKAALPTSALASAPLPNFRLYKAQTVTFKVRFSTWHQIPNGEPEQRQLGLVADYTVQAERPNKMRVLDLTTTYNSRYMKDKKGGISVLFSSSYVSDSKQQLEWDNLTKTYSIHPPASTIATLGKDMDQPHLLYPELLFTPDALNALQYKADGTEMVNGKSAAVYRRLPPNQGETVVYMDLQARVPVRISHFGFDRQGDRQEMVRTDFSDWHFDIKFPPKTFDTTPPPGYLTYEEAAKKRKAKL